MSQTAQAAQLAEVQQLGTFRDEYRVTYSGVTRYCIILYSLAALLCGLDGLLYANDDLASSSAGGYYLAAFFTLPALYYLFYPVIYRSWRVSVYSEGFAFAHGSKLDVF